MFQLSYNSTGVVWCHEVFSNHLFKVRGLQISCIPEVTGVKYQHRPHFISTLNLYTTNYTHTHAHTHTHTHSHTHVWTHVLTNYITWPVLIIVLYPLCFSGTLFVSLKPVRTSVNPVHHSTGQSWLVAGVLYCYLPLCHAVLPSPQWTEKGFQFWQQKVPPKLYQPQEMSVSLDPLV